MYLKNKDGHNAYLLAYHKKNNEVIQYLNKIGFNNVKYNYLKNNYIYYLFILILLLIIYFFCSKYI